MNKLSTIFVVLFTIIMATKTNAQIANFASPVIDPFGISIAPESGKLYETRATDFADLDNDGDYDLILVGETSDLSGYDTRFIGFQENVGTAESPMFTGKITDLVFYEINDISSSMEVSLSSGDFDLDGDIDIISLGQYGAVTRLFTNTGNKNEYKFSSDNIKVNVCDLQNLEFWTSVEAVDLDNDGDQDLVLCGAEKAYSNRSVYFYENNSTNNNIDFSKAPVKLFDIKDNSKYVNVSFHDLDGDMDHDCLIGLSNDFDDKKYYYAENIGDVTEFKFEDYIPQNFNLEVYDFIEKFSGHNLIDIDNNGTIDLFVNGGRDEAKIQYFDLIYFENKTVLNVDPSNQSEIQAIYPNPAKQVVYLDNEAEKIRVFNTQGKLMIELYQPSRKVSVKGLDTGLYYIQIFNKKHSFTKTFYKL